MLTYYLSLVKTPEEKNKVEQLYYQYRKLMKKVAMELLHNEDQVEDAVSESLIKVINALGRFDDAIDSAKNKTFVCIIVRNTALNMLRDGQKEMTIDTETYSMFEVSEEKAFEDVYKQELLERVRKMPDKYRDVLILYSSYAMNFRQIAQTLNISNETVRKRLERARKMLLK